MIGKLECERCHEWDSRVIRTTVTDDGVVRIRRCEHCRHQFSTLETRRANHGRSSSSFATSSSAHA